MSPADLPAARPTVGYVMKVYPRFSETFIVNEILAHEAAGQPLELFSLRAPVDGRFHESLAEVAAPVTYLPGHRMKTAEVWAVLAEARLHLPRLAEHLDELLAADASDACAAVALAQAVVERGIVHLHAHFASSATTVTRLAARMAGISYSFTAHAKDIFHDSVDPADLRTKLADAAAAVTVSDYNLAHLRQTYGADAVHVRRIYNGLDLHRFGDQAPDPGQRASGQPTPEIEGRPSTGSVATERSPLIVAVGRLVEKKGFDVLIDACAQLAVRGRDFRCAVVGTGAEQAVLAKRIAERGVSDRVELLGPRPQGQVRQLVQSAAAFAAPCVVGDDGNRDGLPTVLLEAMALGTPCVSTDVTGIPEVVRHDDTGLQVAQHDAAGLADALERLLTDPALA
ncbi:MAG: glycosyltransferase family 4 protein, partial [Egibacteraceae bacterium]